MQVNVNCADCKKRLGSFVRLNVGKKDVDVEIHACFHRENSQLIARIVESLEWMIKDMKWRHNETKMNVDEGSEGGYSPELQEAIDLLEEIQGPTIEDGN